MNDPLGVFLDVNPSASAEVLAETLSSYFEICVSETLRSMRLPPASIPSASEARLRTLMTRRRRKADRLRLQTVSAHESFVSELHYLRRQLDGDADQSTGSAYSVRQDPDLGTTRKEIRSPQPVTDILGGKRFLDNDGLNSQPLDISPSFLPYSRHLRSLGESSLVRISLEQEVQDLVISDPIFEQVIKTVELTLRTLTLESRVPMELDFAIKSDPEYPHWKRYVIKINTSLDFDTKLVFWSKIDARVRERLRWLHDNRPGDSARIEDIGINLFLHMEL